MPVKARDIYVQYSADELTARLRKDVERAMRSGKISLTESRQLLRETDRCASQSTR